MEGERWMMATKSAVAGGEDGGELTTYGEREGSLVTGTERDAIDELAEGEITGDVVAMTTSDLVGEDYDKIFCIRRLSVLHQIFLNFNFCFNLKI
jgi:hypothetical protein